MEPPGDEVLEARTKFLRVAPLWGWSVPGGASCVEANACESVEGVVIEGIGWRDG